MVDDAESAFYWPASGNHQRELAAFWPSHRSSSLTDPVAQIVEMLQPAAAHSKLVSGAGSWRVTHRGAERPLYFAILEGSCLLSFDAGPSAELLAGDFVLLPPGAGYAISSLDAPEVEPCHTVRADGEVRHGRAEGEADVRLLGGLCEFRSPDADLLAPLLPRLIHIRGEERFTTLVRLLVEESRAQRAAREVVLERLLQVLLIEALRSTPTAGSFPGLLRGLADERLAAAIRSVHEEPAANWSGSRMAREAALSRTVFFERFRRAMGMSPMEYLLAWRMALAKNLLRGGTVGVSEAAERVGYSSASTFSVAFARHVGVPPARYAREAARV